MGKVSMSHEDYLEAIIMLGGSTEQSVRSVDIANQMDVSKASVNKAIGLLKEKGYVDQPYYGDVTLTPEGYEYGSAVYKRHRYLTAFLAKARMRHASWSMPSATSPSRNGSPTSIGWAWSNRLRRRRSPAHEMHSI